MNGKTAWLELPNCGAAIAAQPVRHTDYVHFVQATGRAIPQGVDSDCVVNIRWEDAVTYCQWLSAQESSVYRLPTLAEMIRLVALASKESPIWPCARTLCRAGQGETRCLAEWVSDTIAERAHMRVTFYVPWNSNELGAEPTSVRLWSCVTFRLVKLSGVVGDQ